MMRPFLILPVFALAGACASEPSTDVVGPFTGPIHRYAIDRFDLPQTNTTARSEGDDLNGDDTTDNQLGMVFGALAGNNDLTTHANDMLASGVLQSAIEIVADGLDNDPSVGVRYVGAPNLAFTIMGGAIVDGAFTSNRTKTTMVPGEAELILPVFADADPVRVHAIGLELSYTRARDGGLDIRLAGGIDPTTVVPAIYAGIQTMIAADPHNHMIMMRLFDTNHDWTLTTDELAHNSLLDSLLAADLDMFDDSGRYRPGAIYGNGESGYGADTLSFGFTMHAIACDSGNCAGAIADACHDRAKDGAETGVDCGGSCGKCPGGDTCSVAADCQSQSCNAGTCAAPTCTDGVNDGFESDVDCGGNCGGCANGKTCASSGDCASGYCNALGMCGAN